jgi:hypothetical protein
VSLHIFYSILPFDTPILLFFLVLPKPTSISDFTSHRDCLEARHALLGEALALVEELSALRDVHLFPCHRPFQGHQTVCLLRFDCQELMKEDKQVQWQPRKRRRVQDGTEQGGRYLRQEIDSVDQDWDALIGEASEDAVELEHA